MSFLSWGSGAGIIQHHVQHKPGVIGEPQAWIGNGGFCSSSSCPNLVDALGTCLQLSKDVCFAPPIVHHRECH